MHPIRDPLSTETSRSLGRFLTVLDASVTHRNSLPKRESLHKPSCNPTINLTSICPNTVINFCNALYGRPGVRGQQSVCYRFNTTISKLSPKLCILINDKGINCEITTAKRLQFWKHICGLDLRGPVIPHDKAFLKQEHQNRWWMGWLTLVNLCCWASATEKKHTPWQWWKSGGEKRLDLHPNRTRRTDAFIYFSTIHFLSVQEIPSGCVRNKAALLRQFDQWPVVADLHLSVHSHSVIILSVTVRWVQKFLVWPPVSNAYVLLFFNENAQQEQGRWTTQFLPNPRNERLDCWPLELTYFAVARQFSSFFCFGTHTLVSIFSCGSEWRRSRDIQ